MDLGLTVVSLEVEADNAASVVVAARLGLVVQPGAARLDGSRRLVVYTRGSGVISR